MKTRREAGEKKREIQKWNNNVDNKIKTDPEKYKQFLEKCKKPSNDYYHKNKNLYVEI